MLVFVEVWYRRTAVAEYRRRGIERVQALLQAGSRLNLKVEGNDRRVIVDRATRAAVGIAGVGTLWVTDA
jgi:hypothetical protein